MNTSNLSKILVTTAVSLLCLSSCGGSEGREQKYLSKAENFFTDGNYKKSSVEAKNVLQINPKNIEARFLLGKIQLKNGEIRQAFKNFTHVIQENPEHAGAHLEMAKIYFAADQLEKAKTSIDKALEQQADNKDAQILLAGVYSKTEKIQEAQEITENILKQYPGEVGAVTILTPIYGREKPQKALDLIDSSLSINPDNVILKELKIRVLAVLDRKDEIEPILLSITEQHPNDIGYFYKLSQFYTAQNRPADAEKVLRQAIANNPDNIEAKTMLVERLHQQKNPQKTEATLLAFIEQDPDEYKLVQLLVSFYINNGEQQKAEVLLKELISNTETQSTLIAAQNTLASFYLTQEKPQEAQALIHQVLDIEPTNTEALILSARIKLADGENKNAIADLRAALKNDNNSVAALKLLALAQQGENLLDLAIDNYRRIIRLAPKDLNAWQQAGTISYQQKNNEQAKAFLNHILRVQPDHQGAITLMTTILGDEQQWDEAHAVLAPLLKKPATEALGSTLQARLFAREGQWSKAEPRYKDLVAKNPENYEAVAGYAQSLAQKDLQQAIAFLKGHIQQHDDMHAAKGLLASLYVNNRQTAPAIALYRDIIAKSPNIELAYQKLASIYERQGNIAAAEQVYTDAIGSHPEFYTTQLYLAGFYERQKQYANAFKHYEVLLKHQSQSDIVKNNIAILLVNHFPSKENYQRALDIVSTLEDQKNPYYMDTIGWTHYQLGNISQAISYLQAAVNREQDNAEFRYHLGMAYHKSGDHQRAKQELQLATQNNDANYEGIVEAKKALQLFSSLP